MSFLPWKQQFYLYLLVELVFEEELPDEGYKNRMMETRITYLRNLESVDIRLDIFDL